MLTVNLKQDIANQILSLVGENQASIKAFVDKALRAYLAQLRREKIRAETEAFTQQRQELLAKYAEQYIAMHDGQVIDHDPDLRILHLRVFDQLGQTPVLLKKVTDQPGQEWVFRSPRFERGVIILSQPRQSTPGKDYPLRGQPVRYTEPFEPAAADDWM